MTRPRPQRRRDESRAQVFPPGATPDELEALIAAERERRAHEPATPRDRRADEDRQARAAAAAAAFDELADRVRVDGLAGTGATFLTDDDLTAMVAAGIEPDDDYYRRLLDRVRVGQRGDSA